MLKFFLDLLFEERCIGCQKPGTPLCLSCISCAEPATDPNDMEVFSAFAFHDPLVRKSIQKLKYYRKRMLADSLALALHDRVFDIVAEKRLTWGLDAEEKIILIPVPLSDGRLLDRSYNQAELLARSFARLDPAMSFTVRNDVLYKIKDTKSQVSVKDRKKRLQNVVGVFEIKNEAPIIDKCLILFDDVTTTGATLGECKKVLKIAGAREVFAITVAH